MENIFVNITAAAPTTTVLASKPCILSKIVINKATATGVITVYDNIAGSGTKVATITSPSTLLQNHISLDYGDICLQKGLTIVTATAAQDITVAYRPAA